MNYRSLMMGTTLALALATQAGAKPIKTEDLSNLLIQGQNRLRVSAPIIDVSWAPDIYRDMPGLLKDDTLIGSLKTPSISKPPVELPAKLNSAKVASPWLGGIHEQPILTLSMKPGKEERKVEWTFLIKDSNGKIFFERKEKGFMPERIVWNGFGKGNVPLSVGFDYAYSLSIVDEAGNPQRFSGKPFSIKGFRYKQGDMVTALTGSILFQDDSSLKFSKDGARILAEIKDSLRSHYGKKIEIISYESDEKFGLARSKAIAQVLSRTLELPESRIEVKSSVKGYHHVEIIAK